MPIYWNVKAFCTAIGDLLFKQVFCQFYSTSELKFWPNTSAYLTSLQWPLFPIHLCYTKEHNLNSISSVIIPVKFLLHWVLRITEKAATKIIDILNCMVFHATYFDYSFQMHNIVKKNTKGVILNMIIRNTSYPFF